MANQKGGVVSDGHYFNRCISIDENTGEKTFETYSFWSKASDCELSNGNNLEDEINNINTETKQITNEVEELKKSVSDGKTLVANAITEKGIITATDATFQVMADNINSIGGYHFYLKDVSLEEGSWSGVELSDSAWKSLTTSAIQMSQWHYEHNIGLDINNVELISVRFSDPNPDYGIRETRGGDGVYRYFDSYNITFQKPQFQNYTYQRIDGTVEYGLYSRFYFYTSVAGAGISYIEIVLFDNWIEYRFVYGEANIPFQVHTANPKFQLFFIYK